MLRRLVALVMVLAAGAVPHLATPDAVAQAACGPGVLGDFDCNAVADLVVEAHRYYPDGPTTIYDVIRYPGGQRLSLGRRNIDPDGSAGELVQASFGDLDSDGCADLVLAAQEYMVPGSARLYLVPGSEEGLVPERASRIELPADIVQRVAVLPHAQGSQIAVTTRSERADQALHVVTLDGSFQPVNVTTVTAASLGITPYWNPRFGFGMSLAASGRTIVVGNPNEKAGRFVVGAVHLFTSTDANPTVFRHSRITEDSAHIPGRGLDGSSFGAAVDYLDGRLIIGAPDKQVVRFNNYANNAGQVFLLRWNESTRKYTYLRAINQNTKGVPGVAEPWDQFGYTVLLARGLSTANSYDLVATSSEGIGAARNAGSVLVTTFDTRKGYLNLTQASPGVPGDIVAQHRFGHALARRSGTSSDVLVIGAADRQEPCGNGGLLMQTSGTPLASTTWAVIPAQVDDSPCPNSWPYTLPK